MISPTKTAKDLPEGAEVQTFHTTISRGPDGWVNTEGDRFTDEQVDAVLALGGIITRVPTHRRPPARTN